jgi:RNA polymerase sigma factor (sigma-70 family)
LKSYKSDEELWKAVLQGDSYANEYLYSSYVQQMFNYGLKFGCEKDVIEDCIQEVFVNIIKKRKKLAHDVSVKPYLFKSLRLEIWRSIKKSKPKNNFEEPEFESEYSIDQKIIEDEVQMIRAYEITKVLNELPKRQKEAIYLRFYEGLSYQEISEIMETEQGSSYKIIYKAIDTLYQKLSLKKGKLFY